MISEARSLAVQVLSRVWNSDAFAAMTLDAELGRHSSMDPRDVGLATEFVYGVLRTQGFLLERLAKLTPKGKLEIPKGNAEAHLLIAAYALCFLDRVPAFAAVSEAVGAIRAEGDQRTASFANAILRALAQEMEKSGRPTLLMATAASAPGWLRGALRRSLGRSSAEAYLAAGPIPPPIGLALRAGENRDDMVKKLMDASPDGIFERGKVSPRAIAVRGAGDVRRLPGALEAWIVQEEGAQVVALALGAKPGEKVLDACAGRGNKTWLLADEVAPGGTVDAADLYVSKLERLREGPAGRGANNTFAVDWAAGLANIGDIPSDYDRVLVDAPCSGIGTLRRRPEITLRRTPEDIKRLSELQLAITRIAATRVKDGGTLVFAVCSVLREEGEEVVEKLISEPASPGVLLEKAEFAPEFVKAAPGQSSFRLLPHVDGTDGYFVACFRVRRS